MNLNELDHTGPDRIDVTWKLPQEDSDWSFGTDITYRPVQVGSCPKTVSSERAVTKNNIPVRIK